MMYKNKKTCTIVASLLGIYCLSYAQSIVFFKKNGTQIIVPYENLDSIDTYERKRVDHIEEGKKREFTINGVSFSMIPIKAGTFTMGSESGYADERPLHLVTITDDYYIGESEVTQALWEAVTGRINTLWQSKYGRGGNYPVYSVGYEEVLAFISKLNNITGENFCLPTEAEWEFAAIGGNKSLGFTYSGSNTLKNVGWYSQNSEEKIHEIKKLAPNELGIYDMSGNVAEMCNDWYDSSYYFSSESIDPMGPSSGNNHVVRGGTWKTVANGCRVFTRYESLPPVQVGIRLVLKVD